MRLTAKKIKTIYKSIRYIATDGHVCFLKDKYPLCLEVDNKNEVFLDTGGEMHNCDFFRAKIEDNILYRKNTFTDKWDKATTLYIELEEGSN